MVLLRQVIGDALRARRQDQRRTLREVSTAANVSLGYLSEVERGQKEASSELLAAICDALGARLSEVLRDVSSTVALAEEMPDVLVPAGGQQPTKPRTAKLPVPATAPAVPATTPAREVATDGKVSVSVRYESPLKTTLSVRPVHAASTADRGVYVA